MKAFLAHKIWYRLCNDKWKSWSIAKTHTQCKPCRIGTHFVGQRLRCWVIQQQNWSGWKITCSEILHCVLESEIQIHPISGQPNRRGAWNEHGFVDKLSLPAQEARFIWHVLPGACAIQIKKHIQKNLKWQAPESFDERITFMSVFHDMEWTKERQYRNLLGQCKKRWQHFKPRHWYFLRPASENMWWNGNSNEPQGKWDVVALQMVDMFKRRTSHPIFPATERAIDAWTVEERRKQLTFPTVHSITRHIGKQFSVYLQSNLPGVWDGKSGTSQRTAETKSQSISNPSSRHWLRKKQETKPCPTWLNEIAPGPAEPAFSPVLRINPLPDWKDTTSVGGVLGKAEFPRWFWIDACARIPPRQPGNDHVVEPLLRALG